MGIIKKFFGLVMRSFGRSAQGKQEKLPRTGYSLWDTPLTTDMAVSTVYRCVQVLSDSVGALPLLYKRRKNGVFVTDQNDALSYLFSVQPDPAWNAFDFKKQIIIELLLRGNAYIVPYYSFKSGTYWRLAICGPGCVSHDTTTDTYTISDSINGIYGTYTEPEVIHIKGMAGMDPKRGMSVLSYARHTLEIAGAGDRETLNRFKNGGSIRGILGNDKSISGFGDYQDRELASLSADMDERLNVLGQKIVSVPGDVSWQQLSMTSADMQFLESRKFTVREICRFFGVHPSFVFDDTSNNYKSAEMANVAFLSNTLNPMLIRIETEFLRKLFPSPALAVKRKIVFDRRELNACDLQTKVSYTGSMISNGLLTINEARELEDRPPVDGGDELLVSANLKGMQTLLNEGKAQQVPGSVKNEENDTDDE